MKFFAGFLFLLVTFCLTGVAASVSRLTEDIEGKSAEEKVPIDIVDIRTGYVFESDLNHGGSFGKQYELQNEFEYGHRFLLNGNLYLRLGLSYDRFDFGNTRAPVPVHLQRMAGVISIDYMKGDDIGALLQIKPGFYTEEHLGLASFDCPITLARFFILQPDTLYFLAGAHVSFLRGTYPVIPVVGLVWIPNDTFRFMGVLPEPRLIYSPSDKLELWFGGELVGGSFRTDHDDDLIPRKLSGAAVDYYDFRAGVGLIYDLSDKISLDFGTGYAIQRSFNFNRADEYYRTDPAPYLRVGLKAKF